MDFPRKRSVRQKAFPYHAVVMKIIKACTKCVIPVIYFVSSNVILLPNCDESFSKEIEKLLFFFLTWNWLNISLPQHSPAPHHDRHRLIFRFTPDILTKIDTDFLVRYGICRDETAVCDLGLYSLSGRMSYRKISWRLEAPRFGFRLFQSLWHLTGTSAAALPRCLSNFRTMRSL